MTTETTIEKRDFEPNNETERKLIPQHPEAFEHLRAGAAVFEQIYLSLPGEECSLRVRRSKKPKGTTYTATLKAERTVTSDGVSRFELEVPLGEAAFDYFAAQPNLPRVHKRRATMAPGVTIDWIDGLPTPLIEIEQGDLTDESLAVAAELQLTSLDVSGNTDWDNDQIAYRLYGMGEQPLPAAIDPLDVVSGMVADLRSGQQSSVVTLSGMSGSGKTTLARQVANEIARRYPGLPAPLVVSTDDYHRGKISLEAAHGAPWTNWDAAEVYDTAQLATDLTALRRGQAIRLRHFDFTTQEPVQDGVATPSPFVIVEGIRAATPDLDGVRTRHYVLPTPAATCLLRDIRRVLERPSGSIGTPEERLRYMLEIGLPTYLEQHQPPRERFSESVRPVGSAALEWLRRPKA